MFLLNLHNLFVTVLIFFSSYKSLQVFEAQIYQQDENSATKNSVLLKLEIRYIDLCLCVSIYVEVRNRVYRPLSLSFKVRDYVYEPLSLSLSVNIRDHVFRPLSLSLPVRDHVYRLVSVSICLLFSKFLLIVLFI